MAFGEHRLKRSAKPLFIGSIPIAASNHNLIDHPDGHILNSRGVRDIATDGDELEACYAEWLVRRRLR